MQPKQIDHFFDTLARELSAPLTIILTGAAAGALWGHLRPSVGVDFAVTLTEQMPLSWEDVEAAVERTSRLTGITANYAEDIDQWSPVSLLDYRERATPYKQFGELEVRLLDPVYWTIGKISRYLDPDVHDLAAVCAARRIDAGQLTELWARAVQHSPRSPALTLFRRHAEHFLRTYGQTIWGQAFDADRATRQFRNALGAPQHGRLARGS